MDEIRKQLTQLLEMNWNGKTVWEGIRDGELTSALAFKGNLYDAMPVKIMYVGHAVNGWGLDASGCQTMEEVADVVLTQENGLSKIVNAEGSHYIKNNGKLGIYYHIKSKFFRLIKQILECQNESDGPTEWNTWYSDSRQWHEKFIWANMYCIAPKKEGNPTAKFVKMGMRQYVEIMRAQIDVYKPDVVILCPLKGYFIPWEKEPSFAEIMDSYEECDNGPIIGTGTLERTKIIVCKRPDMRGMSYDDVREMAQYISEYINSVCRN